MRTIYEFEVADQVEEMVCLEEYKGKVLLILNSATQCGFTSQYDGLQDLYEKYAQEGFVILDFPCNQFGNQAPGSNEEIAMFCDSRFGITFPVFSKVDVKGETAIPLFQYLIQEKGFEGFAPDNPASQFLESMLSGKNPDYDKEPDIKWNFTKFLIDREGNVVRRFEPTGEIGEIEEALRLLL